MNGEDDAIARYNNDARRAVSGRAPRHFALLAPLFAAAAASGQPVSGADLAACSERETDEQKLACFEALTERQGVANGEAEDRAPAPVTANADSEGQPPASRQQSDAVDPALPGIDNAAGREHLDRPNASSEPEPEVVTATISKVTRGRNRHYYFHMDNGQIWRQMESGHVRYPRDRAFDVRISRGLMGDYQMRIGGDGRMTRIVRVQ